MLKLTEHEARQEYPDLVVAERGANRKNKPTRVVSARVLFHGSNGTAVNRRTRIRDQHRAPVAADLKRVMREKAKLGEKTFALTADVAEGHRQIPIHPRLPAFRIVWESPAQNLHAGLSLVACQPGHLLTGSTTASSGSKGTPQVPPPCLDIPSTSSTYTIGALGWILWGIQGLFKSSPVKV